MRIVGIYRCITVIVLRWVDDNETALVVKTALDHDSTQHVFAPELLQWISSQGLRGRFSENACLAGQFFVRHAYFLGANDPYKALKTTLKAEIDEEAWESLYSDTSRPFPKPKSGRIAVKVINHLGDEVMKVFAVE